MSGSTNGGVPEGAVLVEGLVRTYPGGLRAVDGVDLRSREARSTASSDRTAPASRPPCAFSHAAAPDRRPAPVAGHDVVAEADAVRRAIGVALQEAALDPL